jgi:hypothetical protein
MSMGVYINMEMPKGCFFCPFNRHLDPDTDKCVLTRDAFDSTFRVVEHRRDNCPLVHVPPHGRCIDADKLMQEMRLFIKENMLSRDDARELLETIEDAPTIIPVVE